MARGQETTSELPLSRHKSIPEAPSVKAPGVARRWIASSTNWSSILKMSCHHPSSNSMSLNPKIQTTNSMMSRRYEARLAGLTPTQG